MAREDKAGHVIQYITSAVVLKQDLPLPIHVDYNRIESQTSASNTRTSFPLQASLMIIS